jgi:3D-(3,5/4)-trihydroxycyclohexane-1,2-dione acylhydrolase (decyclizing)
VCETQAGKSALAWNHAYQLGAVGVTGSPAANELADEADLIIAIGTRLQDFTTGSHSLFKQAKLLSINVQMLDAMKWHATTVVGDAQVCIQQLSEKLQDYQSADVWQSKAKAVALAWQNSTLAITRAVPTGLPYDAHCIGAVQDSAADSDLNDIAVCAAGTLPAELHKLWRTQTPGGYHMEYGYSCMGYEIAGGLGVKMAKPDREVVVMIGDGSYMMLNAEIATSVMLGLKLIIVVQDNRGYGCINRLQVSCGGASFNNLLDNCVPESGENIPIDFAAHAASMGAIAQHVASVGALKAALIKARQNTRTTVLVIDTTPHETTQDGGCWWEVAVPEVSERDEVRRARETYLHNKALQKI